MRTCENLTITKREKPIKDPFLDFEIGAEVLNVLCAIDSDPPFEILEFSVCKDCIDLTLKDNTILAVKAKSYTYTVEI